MYSMAVCFSLLRTIAYIVVYQPTAEHASLSSHLVPALLQLGRIPDVVFFYLADQHDVSTLWSLNVDGDVFNDNLFLHASDSERFIHAKELLPNAVRAHRFNLHA